MDLVESDNDSEKPATRRVTTQTTTEPEPSGVAWIRVVGLIFLAIILIALVVFFARWVYHKVHHAAVNTPPTTSQLQKSASSTNSAQSGTQPTESSGSNSGSSSSSGNSSSAPQSSQSSQTNQGNKLPNNGPGNVLAVFVVTSLAAAGIHYVITDRRLNKTSV